MHGGKGSVHMSACRARPCLRMQACRPAALNPGNRSMPPPSYEYPWPSPLCNRMAAGTRVNDVLCPLTPPAAAIFLARLLDSTGAGMGTPPLVIVTSLAVCPVASEAFTPLVAWTGSVGPSGTVSFTRIGAAPAGSGTGHGRWSAPMARAPSKAQHPHNLACARGPCAHVPPSAQALCAWLRLARGGFPSPSPRVWCTQMQALTVVVHRHCHDVGSGCAVR